MAKQIQIKGYECETCGKAYAFEHVADACCKEYFCKECGVKLNKYWTLCRDCKEKLAYEKAKKMTYNEYINEYGDNMVVFGDDYYSDIEDVLEYCSSYEIEPPKYVWGTKKYRAEIDADSIEENTLSDTFEDAEFSKQGRKELAEFIKSWNEKHGLDYYCEENIVVFVPEDMLNEFYNNVE